MPSILPVTRFPIQHGVRLWTNRCQRNVDRPCSVCSPQSDLQAIHLSSRCAICLRRQATNTTAVGDDLLIRCHTLRFTEGPAMHGSHRRNAGLCRHREPCVSRDSDRRAVVAHLVRPEVPPRIPERPELRWLLDGVGEPCSDTDRKALMEESRLRNGRRPSGARTE